MPKVEVVDFGGGNIASVQRCLERLEVEYQLLGQGQTPSGEHPLILPGVGAFGAVCQALASQGLDQRIRDMVASGTPFLGICVGLQLLFRDSQESPNVPGLGLIEGQVLRFKASKVPQIGWNRIHARQEGWSDGFVYFVNSYYAQPSNPDHIWYEADYEGSFCAAVRSGHISAFQFHPEKSGAFGQRLLGQWCREVL